MEDTNFFYIKSMYSKLDDILNMSSSACTYLNLGYWKNTNNVNKACEALIELVIEEAEIQNQKKILDVGYGYGEQDIYIAQKFPELEIYGVNIIKNQVKIAQQRVDFTYLSNRVFLGEGDAVNLPYQDASFDSTIAIESAFHFNTRHNFFKESYRVLKPGGLLCLTDCLPLNHYTKNTHFIETSLKMGIPIENQYNINEYIERLSSVGFEKISYIDLTKFVLPYSAVERSQKNGWRANPEIVITQNINLAETLNNFTEATTIGNYYLIKAYKKI